MISVRESRTAQTVEIKSVPNPRYAGAEGFTLVEALMAIFVLAIGLMFVAPMLVSSVESTTLARSKDTAGLAAINQIENLALKYRTNPSDAELTPGTHAPVLVEMVNPGDSSKMNRYSVGWTVADVPDVRVGRVLRAVQVTVTVTPIGSGTAQNIDVKQNKVVNVTTIFSLRQS
jgi:Tfp pilus assembly protein PilV